MKANFYLIPLLLLISLFVLESCDKKAEQPQALTEESYNPKTMCDCNDNGIELLNQILTKRKQFEKIEELLLEKDSKAHLELLQKNWKVMQYKCLKTFGSALMRPAECNDPDQIQDLKDKLFKLGVRT
tara:strand:+ start:1670 stop:2053 length:384 start_codon:yes stop_codon:yes gene_type:complete